MHISAKTGFYLFFLTLCFCGKILAQNIVVVGAGVSGLSAAHHLCEAGICNITILEAQDRIGGRIHTIDFHGYVLEEGAQYIHGFRGNPVYKFLVKKTDIPIEDETDDSTQVNIYRSSGNSTDDATRELFYQSVALYEVMRNYVPQIRKTTNLKGVSLLSVAETLWNEVLKNEATLPSRLVLDAMFNYNIIMWSLYSAGHASELGALANDFHRVFFAPDIILPDGYRTLLKFLTEKIPESSIQLNKEVKSINWKRNDNSLESSDTATTGPVIIEYESATGIKDTISADHVIVTVSLGYLQRHHLELFRPNLPRNKQKAISKLRFGTVNKIFLYYENVFWKEEDFPIHVLWDSDVSVEKFGKDFQLFKEINIFQVFKEKFILIWANKPASDMMANMTDSEIGKTMTDYVRKVMNNDTIPYPDDTFITRWGEKKHFLGSYSYTGIDETLPTKRVARSPLVVNGVPRVLFAGEAMHNTRYSTVDGAFASGRNEARRLIRLLKDE